MTVYRAGSRTKLRRATGAQKRADLDFAERLRISQRELRSRLDRRETLVDIMRAVGGTLEPDSVAGFVLERIALWIPAACWAAVVTDHSGELVLLADVKLEPDLGPAVHAVARWVIDHGDPFASADLRHDGRIQSQAPAAALAFCLACRGRRLGALVALDRAPSATEPRLVPSVQRAVQVLLEPVSVALDSALLLKRAEALSVTDDLTQLYNSRYLAQVLRRETKRASRSGHPLSLLFLDLDGFKSINDTYGHLSGSRALVEAAAVIRGSARETDVVARFGGDEFSLVLPDTHGEGALAVAERIRERIAAHAFLTADGLDVHLTVSVGVATLPDSAASADDLMRAADGAMYEVKARGKNGIHAARPPADKQAVGNSESTSEVNGR
jgi:diguanylate cyclase (GGDEF)-like protein